MGARETGEGQDFGAILAAFESEQEGGADGPQVGQRAGGPVLAVGSEAVFVDLGAKSEGMVRREELSDEEGELTVGVGDTVEGLVTARDPESGCWVLRVRPGSAVAGAAAWEELRQASELGMPVEGMVQEVIKGGVRVEVMGVRAFCPLSQLDVRRVDDPAETVGRRLTFRITRLEEGDRGRRRDLVLSRRALLEEEARERAAEARARLSVGTVVRGKVTTVTSYGAFVDLGGVEGLLHVSEMSHSRVEDPRQLFAPEQEVEVEVLKIEPDPKGGDSERISLSRRSLEADPWEGVAGRYPEGTRLGGRVVRVAPFGAFVELEPGVEGLLHASEMGGGGGVADARKAVEEGATVGVRVLAVDAGRRRISLAPAEGGEEAGEDEREHRRSSGSGSFGSLGDFFRDAKIGPKGE